MSLTPTYGRSAGLTGWAETVPMADGEEGLSSSLAVAMAESLRSALHRAFYLNVTVCAIVIYLIYLDVFGSAMSEVKLLMSDAFDEVDAILHVNDLLVADPSVSREYSASMDPFVAISSSAEQAVAGVDSSDPRWLNLDPVQRDRARQITDSIQIFQSDTTFFIGEDLRTLPYHNVTEFSKHLIFPEAEFDNANALKNLHAELYVAKQLGQAVIEPSNWPQSFHFVDYAVSAGFVEVSDAITALRRHLTLNDVVLSVDRINRLCTDNDIDLSTCTPNELSRIFADEPNRLDSSDEQITVSFFPVGISKTLLIKWSPPILLVLALQYAGLERRWQSFVARVRQFPAVQEQVRDVLWSVTDGIQLVDLRRKRWFDMLQSVVQLVVSIAILATPLLAQACVLAFGIHSGWSGEWIAGSVTCLLLTLPSSFSVLLLRLRNRER